MSGRFEHRDCSVITDSNINPYLPCLFYPWHSIVAILTFENECFSSPSFLWVNSPILTWVGVGWSAGLHHIQPGLGGGCGVTWSKGTYFPLPLGNAAATPIRLLESAPAKLLVQIQTGLCKASLLGSRVRIRPTLRRFVLPPPLGPLYPPACPSPPSPILICPPSALPNSLHWLNSAGTTSLTWSDTEPGFCLHGLACILALAHPTPESAQMCLMLWRKGLVPGAH